MKFLKVLLCPIFKSSVSKTIEGRPRSLAVIEKGRFTKPDIKVILKKTMYNFDALYPHAPKESTLGANGALILACYTLALHKSLLEFGLTKEYSMQLIADVLWIMYKKMGTIYLIIARLKSKDKTKKLKICTELFMKFPFNPPGYDMRPVNCDYKAALDVFKCPVADYLVKNDEAEFCRNTWCTLDYSLAEMWGGILKRTTNISSGDECCDFRWMI